jgi:hypothetical protein
MVLCEYMRKSTKTLTQHDFSLFHGDIVVEIVAAVGFARIVLRTT